MISPESDSITKTDAISLLSQGVHHKPCKNVIKWIPLLLNLAQRSTFGRDMDSIRLQQFLVAVLDFVSAALQCSDPHGVQWSKAVVWNDRGKQFLTLCCGPNPDGSPNAGSFLPLHTFFSNDDILEHILGTNMGEMFDRAWEYGMGKFCYSSWG